MPLERFKKKNQNRQDKEKGLRGRGMRVGLWQQANNAKRLIEGQKLIPPRSGHTPALFQP